MVSKGDLGVSYLVTVGIVLFGIFSAGILLPVEASGGVEVRSILGLSMGVMIAGSFLVTGIGLARSTLDDDRVWRVAGWSTIGLGFPTLLAVLVILLAPSTLRGLGWRSVVIVNIAAGGVVGVLVGSLLELRAEHERTRTLNQRNTVFLRLFRHDIRTSLNLIRGHLDLVGTDDTTLPESPEVIRAQLEHIERLSDAANRLDDLESMTETEPVDLGALVRDRLDELRRSTDGVTVGTEIQSETYVRANDLLSSVVDNLLRNAVEHGSTSPRSQASENAVEHGSTSPRSQASKNAVEHGSTSPRTQSGDAWLRVTVEPTIVDAYDGEFTVHNAVDGGAVATVTLPTATPSQSNRESVSAGDGGVEASARSD